MEPIVCNGDIINDMFSPRTMDVTCSYGAVNDQRLVFAQVFSCNFYELTFASDKLRCAAGNIHARSGTQIRRAILR